MAKDSDIISRAVLNQTQEQLELARRIDDMVREADQSHEQYRVSIQDNYNIFLLGHDGNWTVKDGVPRAVVNMTQTAIISTIAAMTNKPATVNFNPVETGEKPIYYITDEGYNKLAQVAQHGGMPFDFSKIKPNEEVPYQIGQILDEMSQQQIDPTNGQPIPTILSPDDIVTIDDKTASDAMQTGVGILLGQANADYYLYENIFNCSIIGYCAMVLQWNADSGKVEMFNAHPLNIRIDPIQTTIDRSGYVILEEVMSKEEAIAKFPDFEDQIKVSASSGKLEADNDFQIGAIYQDTDFKRDMVRVRVAWMRWEMYPMAEQEALDRGLVTQEPVVIGPDGKPYEGDPEPVGDAIFDSTVTQELQTDTQYVLVDNGKPVKFGSAKWPKRSGVRQVTKIGQYVVDDRESPYAISDDSEIPVCWNRNIPIPNSPFGQGEPERAKALQAAINRTADTIIRHGMFNQSPERVISMSMKTMMGNSDDMHGRPGRVYVAPDAQFQAMGDGIVKTLDVPQLPAWQHEIYSMFIENLNNLLGNTEALQGVASYSGQSGQAIQALQQAAQGPVAVRSRHAEAMIRRLNLLVAQMLIDFVPETQWVKMMSKYPPQISLAFRDRAKRMQFDVEVLLASGSGLTSQAEQQNAINLYNLGLRSKKTTMEAVGTENVTGELAQMQHEAAEQAMGAGGPPQQEQAQPKPLEQQ